MGSCFSSASLKNQASLERKECEEEIQVCVERGDDGLSPDEKRRIASLYSHRGNKGLNQDAAILCKVCGCFLQAHNLSRSLVYEDQLFICFLFLPVKGYGTEEGLFCGVFDGHGTSGHTVSRVVRDYLHALLLGERNALLLAQEDDDFTDGTDTSSTDGEEVFDEWKEACINAFKTMDEELKVRPNLDCSFSGTTAVSVIKQVQHDSKAFLVLGYLVFDHESPSVTGGRSDHCQPWGLEGCHGNRIRGGSPRGDSADDRPEAQRTS